MKPASVINQGDHFVTLRATTDRPAEIREALAARDVLHVFKGDQNQAWDAVIANHCLARAVGDSEAELTFFVQDERLGTSDVRLARYFRRDEREYVLTEDYYRGRAGAVWEHQDVSHGLFFTEAVSPEQFATAAVHLGGAAETWERHSKALLQDTEWLRALTSLGITFPGSESTGTPDAATGLGPAVNASTLAELFADHPSAWLYYAYTKTDGLYGLVPVENDNATLSSIPLRNPELLAHAKNLLRLTARGALRLADSAPHRRGIKQRARELGEWAERFLEDHPAASVTDFQQALGRYINDAIFPTDRIELDRTSRFMHVDRSDLPRLRTPERTLQFFLDVALRHPRAFTEAYNDALNRVGFGLQRMKYDLATGRYTPPFFVDLSVGGEGPVYRYGLELSGTEATTIRLTHPTAGDVIVASDRRISSVYDLARALFENLDVPNGFTLVGKAATFAAELQRTPRGLGLPRQGSKYTPMVDHLVSGLRARGILDQPTGLLIRIGLNALDRFSAMGDISLRLPRFLQGVLGRRINCNSFADEWRGVAADAHDELQALGSCYVGQHVHLTRLMAHNARGKALQPLLDRDARLMKLARQLSTADETGRVLRDLGRDLSPEAVSCIERLDGRRTELLSDRQAAAAAAAVATRHGRVVPDWAPAAQVELEQIELQLLLIYAAYVRRLWQRAESLPYLNDRPYTLSLYLLFGRDIFPPICRNVEFDVEYVSPCPVSHLAPQVEYHALSSDRAGEE
ncbi:MAG: hypothetical protein K0Q72_2423 [Armatimonadetes bacterium]|nr:hypothetical protein [Armatimonadota bacterium]